MLRSNWWQIQDKNLNGVSLSGANKFCPRGEPHSSGVWGEGVKQSESKQLGAKISIQSEFLKISITSPNTHPPLDLPQDAMYE